MPETNSFVLWLQNLLLIGELTLQIWRIFRICMTTMFTWGKDSWLYSLCLKIYFRKHLMHNKALNCVGKKDDNHVTAGTVQFLDPWSAALVHSLASQNANVARGLALNRCPFKKCFVSTVRGAEEFVAELLHWFLWIGGCSKPLGSLSTCSRNKDNCLTKWSMGAVWVCRSKLIRWYVSGPHKWELTPTRPVSVPFIIYNKDVRASKVYHLLCGSS